MAIIFILVLAICGWPATGYSFGSCVNDPVETGGAYYSDLQSGYNDAADSSYIRIHATTFDGDLACNRPISVILKGGFDCQYTTNTSVSTIKGVLTVSKGTVTFENLVL